MHNFKEIPLSQASISNKRIILGVGINDAKYMIRPVTSKSRGSMCPYYCKWYDMITRCYDKGFQEKNETYKGCSVTQDWLIFSNFKSWMKSQNWEGKSLDKDIITPGNKIYSPEKCSFVTQQLNNLILYNTVNRGKYPLGVSLHKITGKYRSTINVNGKCKHIGLFRTIKEASEKYCQFKSNLIMIEAYNQTDNRIKEGLIKHAKMLKHYG